jgi:GR25 family glycosyltransferase involved in LPS biosynthesis
MSVFVVNCDIHTKRLKTFASHLKSAGMTMDRVACVNGRKMGKSFLCDMHKDGLLRATAQMTAIEVAINLSHLAVWQRIAEGRHSHGLVFEDDVRVHKNFVRQVTKLMKALEKDPKAKDFGILFLWNGKWDKRTRYAKVLKVPGTDLTVEKMTNDYNGGGVAYILSKKMAAFLSDPKHFFPIEDPQDVYMGDQSEWKRRWGAKWTCLSLKMRYDRKTDCQVSPLIDLDCGGDWSTGDTTQRHDDPKVFTMRCSKHKRSKSNYGRVIKDKFLKRSFRKRQ